MPGTLSEGNGQRSLGQEGATEDDQDILAALENTETLEVGDKSMFACPICENLVTHGEMFSHLDQCTQNI